MVPESTELQEAAFSGNIRLLQNLLDENALNPNEQDWVQQTPLHKAAMNGWLSCVELLVRRGAHINTPDVAGCTALHYAACNGYLPIARYLVETNHASMSQKSNKGHTPRYMAKSRGQSKLVAFFNEMENKIDGNKWLS